MLAALAVRCHQRRDESHRNQGKHVYGIDVRLYHLVQQVIVSDKGIHYTPLENSAFSGPFVIIPGPALVTTELLVSTPVSYLISALQTQREMSFKLLIRHCQHLLSAANIRRVK